jgi:hypothetical protein
MERLFKALPTELQWEILCVFVGSHVVRNNRLRRRLDGRIHKEILNNAIEYSEYRRLHHRFNAGTIGKYPPLSHKIPYTTIAIINFSGGGRRILIEDMATNQLSWWVVSNNKWVVSTMEDRVLPPFVKRVYPSWESTDKKKGIIWQKVVLYDPRKNNAEYYGVGSDWYKELGDS